MLMRHTHRAVDFSPRSKCFHWVQILSTTSMSAFSLSALLLSGVLDLSNLWHNRFSNRISSRANG